MSAGQALEERLVIHHVPHDAAHVMRKTTLITLGLRVLTAGRGWLVHAVHVALVREDPCDA